MPYMDNMDKGLIRRLASRHENFYLYDGKGIGERIRELKENFPNVDFLYSVKCNSDPNILRLIFSEGLGADVSSLGEVILSSDCGAERNGIYYSSPGKTDSEIKQALPRSNIIADSFSEIERIKRLAHSNVKIGVRINPNFTMSENNGYPSKFGIDEEDFISNARALDSDKVKIAGIHIHIKSQMLDIEQLAWYYSNILDLTERIEKVLGRQLEYVNMGSGIGIPYSKDESELDLPALGKRFSEISGQFRSSHKDTKLIIESGRFIVCKNGYYVTHVIDKKQSRGRTFIILKNTLNGFIRPSLAHLVMNYSDEKMPGPSEPLFTCPDEFEMIPLVDTDEKETVTVTGDLCTASDTVASDIEMPKMNIGDTVVFTNAGAYAAVLTPMQFSSQHPPLQYTITEKGELLH